VTTEPTRGPRFAAVLRQTERVTPLELFFDLVFVLALTQVSPTFNIREAPFARGYFLGDYMGLDFGGGFATAWGSTLGGGPSSIFSNTLTP
jgi:hypothetical protein